MEQIQNDSFSTFLVIFVLNRPKSVLLVIPTPSLLEFLLGMFKVTRNKVRFLWSFEQSSKLDIQNPNLTPFRAVVIIDDLQRT